MTYILQMFSGDTMSGPIDILRLFKFSPYVVKSRVSAVSVATADLILPESSNKVGQSTSSSGLYTHR